MAKAHWFGTLDAEVLRRFEEHAGRWCRTARTKILQIDGGFTHARILISLILSVNHWLLPVIASQSHDDHDSSRTAGNLSSRFHVSVHAGQVRVPISEDL